MGTQEVKLERAGEKLTVWTPFVHLFNIFIILFIIFGGTVVPPY